MLKITELIIYPIKSLGGIQLEEVQMTDRGPAYDRRWMLVDPEGNFLTQRTNHSMALIQTALHEDGIMISAPYPSLPDIKLRFADYSGQTLAVNVWDDNCPAQLCGEQYDSWFTQALGQPCHLVFMHEQSHRKVDTKIANEGELTSFSDGYPSLIIGQQSLNLLNKKLDEPVMMDRFRPNFVFSGGTPHCEDEWKHFRIGSIDFFGVKPCSRCVMTTIDQQKAQAGKEPLKTLATYRRLNNKVMFGQNLLHKGIGSLKIGDEIMLLKN